MDHESILPCGISLGHIKMLALVFRKSRRRDIPVFTWLGNSHTRDFIVDSITIRALDSHVPVIPQFFSLPRDDETFKVLSSTKAPPKVGENQNFCSPNSTMTNRRGHAQGRQEI